MCTLYNRDSVTAVHEKIWLALHSRNQEPIIIPSYALVIFLYQYSVILLIAFCNAVGLIFFSQWHRSPSPALAVCSCAINHDDDGDDQSITYFVPQILEQAYCFAPIYFFHTVLAKKITRNSLHISKKIISASGTLSSRPPTVALPLDPAGYSGPQPPPICNLAPKIQNGSTPHLCTYLLLCEQLHANARLIR